MTDDIRYTLCRKSGKVWCFFVRRSGTPPDFHTVAPKVGPHAGACAYTRPRHRRGVGGRPHVRWSVERTASLAVAKPRCSGGQTRWTCEGIQSGKVASGRCSPISTNHVALFGLSCTRLGLVSTLYLALAIFQQGAPCFGHCPFFNN